jgi:UDP-glucuronate decarboxylase
MYDLVAGGAGFIGSNLCARLLREGRRVICIDNLATGSWQNIHDFEDDPRFTLLERDIIRELPPLPRVERIFHLASPASPPGYLENPVATLRVNSEGTRRLLELAALCGARFLYAGTSEVYGDALDDPQSEDSRACTNPVGPRSMYHEAKRYGEALTAAFWSTEGVDGRIVRIFNAYGPRSDPNDGRIVPNFIVQALRGQSLTVYGDGTQTRSFCYVDDLVEGLLRVIDSAACGREVVNLGNPDEFTVLDCARLVLELTGSQSPIEHVPPLTAEEPRRRRPDIAKAIRLTARRPEWQFRSGLEWTISYFREQIGIREPLEAGRG